MSSPPALPCLSLACRSSHRPSPPTRNRHWRMSFCCKGGKAAVLLPTRRYATAPGATTEDCGHGFAEDLCAPEKTACAWVELHSN